MTLWTVDLQTPLSMGSSRQEHWSGLQGPPPGDLSNPGTEPRSSSLQADSLSSEPPGKPQDGRRVKNICTLGIWPGIRFSLCDKESCLTRREKEKKGGREGRKNSIWSSPGLVSQLCYLMCDHRQDTLPHLSLRLSIRKVGIV